MRQWPTDPNGFLKEGNSFFFHVEESWEWFSGRERCILDMNKQLFIRRSVLYCRKLLCCSALWHYPEVKVGKKSLGDWFSLYSNISLEMLLSPSLIFKFSGLKVSTREIRIVFLVWFGFHFLQIFAPFTFYFIFLSSDTAIASPFNLQKDACFSTCKDTSEIKTYLQTSQWTP